MRPSLTRALPVVATGAALVALAVSRIGRVTVVGPSMLPTLEAGDRLAVVPVSPRAGRLIVAADPRHPTRLLVKRAHRVAAEGVDVRGDNPLHSTDSRDFGPVPHALVRGRPFYRYAPADRAGWVLRD